MAEPRVQNLPLLEWQPHPTLQGVMTKVLENRATHGLADVLVAQVAPGGEIPWHVHENASETAYVLSGEGVIQYAPADDRDHPVTIDLKVAAVLTIPPTWWHRVYNSGETPLELFAFHTPPTF
jgi:mannose-6-phosphate isomerase-like protein (cupin superfamily)